MASSIVLGLGFGDCGKGITTDYRCRQSINMPGVDMKMQYNQPLVVRFSGGQQAGHTVVHNGIRHVFSNFGSGTLRGAHTYWSEHCTFDPIGVFNEWAVLRSKGIKPVLHVNGKCPVTTPYDSHHNRMLSAKTNHGTCGVGIGTTKQREEDMYSLLFEDLFNPWVLRTKLDNISKYYNKEVDEWRELTLVKFLGCVDFVKQHDDIHKVYELPGAYGEYIFEGSQGLLLDQDMGFFPYVTRGNTGTKNALNILRGASHSLSPDPFSLYLVTRAYQTRHGNGPMTNEDLKHSIKIDPDETNVHNDYQGEFRRTPLDLDLMQYAIMKDEYIRKNIQYANLVVTCVDHLVDGYPLTHNGKYMEFDSEGEFLRYILHAIRPLSMHVSRTPVSDNMEQIT